MPESPAPESLESLMRRSAQERGRWLREGAARDPVEAGRAIRAMADELDKLALTDLPGALAAGEALVRLADEAPATDGARARVRRARAQAMCYANQYAPALEALREAASIADGSGEALEAARARHTMVHALARLGRYDEAVTVGEAAYAAFVAGGDALMAARADVNLGVTHRMRDDPARALLHFDRGRPTFAGQAGVQAQIDSNRAEALLDLHRFQDAEAAFGAAFAALQASGAARAAAIVEGNLADLAGRQGRLGEAVTRFEMARRRLDESGAPGDAARLRSEQAEVFLALGCAADAAGAFGEAIPTLRAHALAYEAARASAGLGRALMLLGRDDEAGAALEEAATQLAALGNASAVARVRLMQAELDARQGRTDQAEARAAHVLAGSGDRPGEAVAAELRLAVIAMGRGRFGEGERLATAALGRAERLAAPPLVADALHARAAARRGLGRTAEALADLRRAVAAIDRLRGAVSAERLRTSFLGGRAGVYEEYASTALDAGEGVGGPADGGGVLEACVAVELAKARGVVDLIAGGEAAEVERGEGAGGGAGPDASEAALGEQLERRRAELAGLYGQLESGGGAEGATAGQRGARWREAVESVERRMQELEVRLQAGGPGAVSGAERGGPAGAADVEAVLAGMAPGTAIIEYFSEHEFLSALVLRGPRADGGEGGGGGGGEEVRAVRRLARTSDVLQHVRGLMFQIARAMARGLVGWGGDPGGVGGRAERAVGDAMGELARLRQAVFEPVAPLLEGVRGLTIVPHGPLFAVPFGALAGEGGRVLGDDYEISMAPSIMVLERLRRLRSSRGPGALVVGLADEAAPDAEAEAEEIGAILAGRGGPARVLRGGEATIGAVLRAMGEVGGGGGGVGLVHLATHCRFLPQAPMASGIRLSDGWLTPRDIQRSGLGGAAVVLSACDTGRAAAEPGNELAGFVRAFLGAGASALVMSLWPVHDESTREMMADLHRRLAQGPGDSAASALRFAQTSLRAHRPHPGAWAPFVCVG